MKSDLFKSMWLAGKSNSDIAHATGVPRGSVSYRARVLGLPCKDPERVIPDNWLMVAHLFYHDGMTYRQIARRLGMSRGAVSGALTRVRATGRLGEFLDGAPASLPPEPPEPEEPRSPVIDHDSPDWQCEIAGCRGTRQPGRDRCATHLPKPPRMRAEMAEIGA